MPADQSQSGLALPNLSLSGISIALALACSAGLLVGHHLWGFIGGVLTQHSNQWLVDFYTGPAPADQPVHRDGLLDFVSGNADFSPNDLLLHGGSLAIQWLLYGVLIALVINLCDTAIRSKLPRLICKGSAAMRLMLDCPAPTPLPAHTAAIAALFGFLAAMGFGFAAELGSRLGVGHRLGLSFFRSGLLSEAVVLTFAFACVCSRLCRWWRGAAALRRQRHWAGIACSACGYDLRGAASTRCPECSKFAPPLMQPPAARDGLRSATATLIACCLWTLAAIAPSLWHVPRLPSAMWHRLNARAVLPPAPSLSTITLPYSRPVRLEGSWGRAWLLAVELPSRHTALRIAIINPAGETTSQTLVFGSNTPVSCPALGTSLQVLRTRERIHQHPAEGDGLHAAVRLYSLSAQPDRITSFPDASAAPPDFAILLRTPQADPELMRILASP